MYSKYIKYKMKYLNLKNLSMSFVNEESKQDSFRNKFKYLTLKSNLEFAESNELDYGKMKYLNLKNLKQKIENIITN